MKQNDSFHFSYVTRVPLTRILSPNYERTITSGGFFPWKKASIIGISCYTGLKYDCVLQTVNVVWQISIKYLFSHLYQPFY